MTKERGGMSRHVLIARMDNNGDVLLTGPAVRAVARRSGKLTFLCSPRGTEAAALLPGVDEIISYRAGWIDKEPGAFNSSNIYELVALLKNKKFDQALILTSLHQSPLPMAMIARLAGIRYIAAISEDYPGNLLDLRHNVPDNIHEVDRSLSLALAAGYPTLNGDDRSLDMALPASARQFPNPFDLSPYVIVHPGATAPARTLGPNEFARLVAMLADTGHNIVLTGSPNEISLSKKIFSLAARMSEEPARFASAVKNLAGQTKLGELGHVIDNASAIVCGNTGTAHIAAAVRTPVVLVYPPTVPFSRWRPWQVPYAMFGDQSVDCAGCRARICPLPERKCLRNVTAEALYSAVNRLASARIAEQPSPFTEEAAL